MIEVLVNSRVSFRLRGLRMNKVAFAALYLLAEKRSMARASDAVDTLRDRGFECGVELFEWLASMGFVAKCTEAPDYVITEVGRKVVAADRENIYARD